MNILYIIVSVCVALGIEFNPQCMCLELLLKRATICGNNRFELYCL